MAAKTVTKCEIKKIARGWEYWCWYNGKNDTDYAIHLCDDHCTDAAAAFISCVRDITKYRGLLLGCYPIVVS